MNYTILQDNELLELMVAHDNQRAFHEIYVRYWQEVFMVAYKKVRDKELAEELTQNLFVSLWERRQEGNIQNLSSYLFGALKYSIINHYKSQIVHEKYMSYVHSKSNSSAHTTEQLILLKDLAEAIEKGSVLLPKKTQQVFKLSRVDHFSVKEISKILNISEKAVEYHITQSLKVIRGYLKDYLLYALVVSFLF